MLAAQCTCLGSLAGSLDNPESCISGPMSLGFVLCAGEGPCLATFFVRRYWQLLLLRSDDRD